MAGRIGFDVRTHTAKAIHDQAIVLDGEEPLAELVQAAQQSLNLDIHVTVGGVTMFLAAWEDPAHWSEEWVEKLGLEDLDDAESAVRELVAGAMKERVGDGH